MDNNRLEGLKKRIMDMLNNDEDFVKAFVSSADAPALKQVLNEQGIEISLEEVESLFAVGMEEIKNAKEAGELTENQLEDVAGGGFWRGMGRLAVSSGVAFGYGCLCGVCPAACTGSGWVVGGLTAWTTAGFLK